MRTRIGIGIEEPQNPSPEVTHILKRIGLAPNATIEHVRAAIQMPEKFAALNTTDLAILAGHFNKPIEVRDDAVMGSKLDGVSGPIRDQVLAIQQRAFLKSGMRRPASPQKTALIEKLRASNAATEKSLAARRAGLIAKLQRLSLSEGEQI